MDYFFDGELNINDYFLILAMQLFEYELFVKIKNYYEILAIDMDFTMGDEPNEIIIELTDEFIKDIGDYWITYQEVLIFLFPILKGLLTFPKNYVTLKQQSVTL